MVPHVVSQEPLSGEAFRAVRTLKSLTYKQIKTQTNGCNHIFIFSIMFNESKFTNTDGLNIACYCCMCTTLKTIPLTFYGGLPSNVVEELCVVGEHSSAGRTCHQLFLCVTTHVLSQLKPAFKRGLTV